MIIETFLKNVQNNPDKIAFIYYEKSRITQKTYAQVYHDMAKIKSYFESKQIALHTTFLMFIKPSYPFYVFLLTCFYYNYHVVIIDSFRDKQKVNAMIKQIQVDYLVTNDITNLLKARLSSLKSCKTVSIDDCFSSRSAENSTYMPDHGTILTTFTSGTTGVPKVINRTMKDLNMQFAVVQKAIDNIDGNDIVLTMLPVYVLANLIFNITNVIYEKKLCPTNRNELLKLMHFARANAIVAPVSKLLVYKYPFQAINKIFTGGSLLHYRDALKIKTIFPNAVIVYVYGASEVVMMARTTLNDYIENLQQNRICIGHILFDNQLEIRNTTAQEIGEIYITGDTIINEEKIHATGDLGFIHNQQLYLKGKKQFSNIREQLYNYEIEMNFLNDYPHTKQVAFLSHHHKNYLFYVGRKVKQPPGNIQMIRVRKLPTDIRHQYKIDYPKLISYLNNK